ncbi:MAG TPA: hypothetical protein VIU12_16095, partial [Chryseolinea sp.]
MLKSPHKFFGKLTFMRSSLIILLECVCLAHAFSQLPQADALVDYSRDLELKGAVQIGSQGLAIEGEQISGVNVRRPSEALARAAELYAEAGGKLNQTMLLNKALGIWEEI